MIDRRYMRRDTPTLSWPLIGAHLDLDIVDRHHEEPEFEQGFKVSVADDIRILFCETRDPGGNILEEGEHPGWAAAIEFRSEDSMTGWWGEEWYFWQPFQIEDMLKWVAEKARELEED